MGRKIDPIFKPNSSIPAPGYSEVELKEHNPVQECSPGGCGPLASSNDRNILLVSDDDRQRSLLRAYLQHVGFNVFSCADLDAALRMLGLHRALRLVLVDSHLLATPASQLSESFAECYPEVPIFAITGKSAMDGTLRALKHHVWEPDSQPLPLPDLLGRIQALADGQPDAHTCSRDPGFKCDPAKIPGPAIAEPLQPHIGNENASSDETRYAPMIAAEPAVGR